jgi:hypothetical protein
LEDRRLLSVFTVNTLKDLSISAGVNPATGKINGTHFVTLRSAIEAANAKGGSNTINLRVAGTYQITIPPASPDDDPSTEDNTTGDFDIIPSAGGSLNIVNTSRRAVAVSGNGLDRVFDINPNEATSPAAGFTVFLKGFTIENGIASPGDGVAGSGGGIRVQGNSVNLTLAHMVVKNNSATADGGGLVMFNPGDSGAWTLTLKNTVISHNHAGDAGGGIDTDGAGTVVINNSLIDGNTDIHQGAGIYVDVPAGSSGDFTGANMTMTRTVVSNNDALASGITASGGGISNAGMGTMNILNSTVINNFSGGQGGGFSDENGFGTLVVKNSLFLGNSAILDGGAIQEGGPSTQITNTEFRGNSSGATGGALFANGTTLDVQSSTFANNTSVGNGGGIEVETGPTASSPITATITNTTITGNRALNNAGGLNGGGIDAVGIGSLALLNDTINANFADNGGGVFWDGSGMFSVQNTIIAGNTASTLGPDANNPAGTFTDNGGNLIGSNSGNTGFTASTQIGTVTSPLAPLLGPLGNNGGPTIGAPGTTITLETEAPHPGSPAIGKGVLSGAPNKDARGFPSVVHGKINVGAVSQAHRRR